MKNTIKKHGLKLLLNKKPLVALGIAIVLTVGFFLFLSLRTMAFQDGDYTYTLAGGNATITGYTGSGGAINIPTTLGGNNVVGIGFRAFQNKIAITSVVIPDNIVSIGDGAFLHCRGITSMVIGSGVTNIQPTAFSDTPSMAGFTVDAGNTHYSNDASGVLFNKAQTTLIQYPAGISGAYVIPGSVTTIGDRAFTNSIGLTDITIPDGVTTIGENAFYGCTGLTSVSIPGSVTSISSSVFGDCTNLTSVTISDGVTSIGPHMFEDCIFLASINIPSSVVNIGDYAFNNCIRLVSANISFGVESIGSHSFYGCTGLTSITIPNSVASIGEYAFYGCTGLTSMAIPDSVVTVSDGAFQGCTGITSISIGNGISTIGNSAFSGCTALIEFTVDAGNTEYASDDGVLFNKDETLLVQYPDSKPGAYVIPGSATSIGDYAFNGSTSLTSLTIPDSVSHIGAFALSSSLALTEFIVDAGNADFSSTEGVLFDKTMGTLVQYPSSRPGDTYAIPDGVTTIGPYALTGSTLLTSVGIPESVNNIGDGAFQSATGLTAAYFSGNAPETVGGSIFYDCAPTFTIYYLDGKTGWTNPWNGYTALTQAEVTATTAVETAENSNSQSDVDLAQALVAALPDGAVKTDLQARLDVVQGIINENNQSNRPPPTYPTYKPEPETPAEETGEGEEEPTTPVSQPVETGDSLDIVQASPIPPFDDTWGADYPGGRVKWALKHRENIYHLYVNFLGRQPTAEEVNWWLTQEPNINVVQYLFLTSDEYKSKH